MEPEIQFASRITPEPTEEDLQKLSENLFSPAITAAELGQWQPPTDVEIVPKFLFKGGITLLSGAAKAARVNDFETGVREI
jgi:hypothetical protein